MTQPKQKELRSEATKLAGETNPEVFRRTKERDALGALAAQIIADCLTPTINEKPLGPSSGVISASEVTHAIANDLNPLYASREKIRQEYLHLGDGGRFDRALSAFAAQIIADYLSEPVSQVKQDKTDGGDDSLGGLMQAVHGQNVPLLIELAVVQWRCGSLARAGATVAHLRELLATKPHSMIDVATNVTLERRLK
jgi:hypothetical protein